MKNISEIIKSTNHRPFQLPSGKWNYYQEWNKVLFLHWVIPTEILRSCVPNELVLDSFNGCCYVSLVAFTMEKIRHRNLPSIKIISEFDEINLRTYIETDGKKGVYFLSIEAGKILSTYIARALSGLPYEKANIIKTQHRVSSVNKRKSNYLDVEFEIGNEIILKSDLDRWLTERYCLYLEEDGRIFRYDIHHKEWCIKTVKINRMDFSYRVGEMNLNEREANLVHYSDGVEVIAWARQKI